LSQHVPQIKIEGRSGCKLSITKSGEQLRVKKYSSHAEYNDRLKKQQLKQQLFNVPELSLLGFNAPNIYADGLENDLYWFEMKYAGGEKYSDYLTRISKTQLDALAGKFLGYFQFRIASSKLATPPTSVITSKINSLEQVLQNNKKVPQPLLKQVIKYLITQIPQTDLYEGSCHGDFTLSNMLFSLSGDVVTFDLLDSFIESPVIDLVKLRQDTKYRWSLFVEDYQGANRTKLIQILDYIDRILINEFKHDTCIKSWEKYLTVFNFARILPYAKDSRDIKYLQHHLTLIL
jgi:hypothetical protein